MNTITLEALPLSLRFQTIPNLQTLHKNPPHGTSVPSTTTTFFLAIFLSKPFPPVLSFCLYASAPNHPLLHIPFLAMARKAKRAKTTAKSDDGVDSDYCDDGADSGLDEEPKGGFPPEDREILSQVGDGADTTGVPLSETEATVEVEDGLQPALDNTASNQSTLKCPPRFRQIFFLARVLISCYCLFLILI
jgi:hypothetical protein